MSSEENLFCIFQSQNEFLVTVRIQCNAPLWHHVKHMLGEKGIQIHILKKVWHMVQENVIMKLDDTLLYLLESCL